MFAVLVHFLGFYVVNAIIPAWVWEVDGELASIWYLSFVCIDAVALSITRHPMIKTVLAASCAWSAALSLETWFLRDAIQSFDFVAQYLIDAALIALVITRAWSYGRRKLAC